MLVTELSGRNLLDGTVEVVQKKWLMQKQTVKLIQLSFVFTWRRFIIIQVCTTYNLSPYGFFELVESSS